MSDTPNVITPKRLAVALIRRAAGEALADSENVPPGGEDWVFFMRLRELLGQAATRLEEEPEP